METVPINKEQIVDFLEWLALCIRGRIDAPRRWQTEEDFLTGLGGDINRLIGEISSSSLAPFPKAEKEMENEK